MPEYILLTHFVPHQNYHHIISVYIHIGVHQRKTISLIQSVATENRIAADLMGANTRWEFGRRPFLPKTKNV